MTEGEAMYLVLPDGFVMLDGEDCVPDWKRFMGYPRCHEAHEPKGPIVTRMELESCATCDGKGESIDRWESEIDQDEEGRPYRTCYPVHVKCEDCDGTGWRYDWGSNVSLAKIIEEVRGNVEVAA
jgi:RecJ-like exonuclease